VASAARSTTQADNDPQPLLRSTLPPSDSIKPQQQNQRLASAVAPITAYESANFMSQHTGRQNVVETPVTPASIATGEVETQVTLSPVNETSQPASRSTARAPRQPRGTTAPDTAKHQPPELNPKQVITPAPMHTPSLEAAGLQYQAETDRQTVMARVNAAPRPTPPSATRLLEQHNDRLSLGSDDVAPPVVSASTANPARPLPLITGPNLSDKIDETFAPYRSDQNSLQPVVVEESIKPRPDLNLLATSAALPETAARHQQAETLTEPPTIRVTIGRIEVRTTTTPPSAAPRPRPAQPTISLQDYLKQNRSRKS
jgi:hypothetical protein